MALIDSGEVDGSAPVYVERQGEHRRLEKSDVYHGSDLSVMDADAEFYDDDEDGPERPPQATVIFRSWS
jgi:hypothetical protein